MTLVHDVEEVLASSRRTRKEVAERLRETRHARMAVQWQRVRARKQFGQLEQRIEELNITLAQAGPPRLTWTSPHDALDDVLFPLD
jgi:chromosome segregation ATPase